MVLLSFLAKRLNKQNYALKGGCNLRFFLGSPRYSEDMDIDVHGVAVYALQDIVNTLLESKPFIQLLRTVGVEIVHINEHKQTETTQRWEFGLKTATTHHPIPTKVEFSRRGLMDGVVLEQITPLLTNFYRLPPLFIPHYQSHVALLQKIEAIASRSVTQAGDIFDFSLLYSVSELQKISALLPQSLIAKARENALNLSFADFKSQVVAFLTPESRPMYDTEECWLAMQLKIIDALEP